MNATEALAEAWASMDGRLDESRRGKTSDDYLGDGGYYAGYMVEAEEVLRRLEARDYHLVHFVKKEHKPGTLIASCGHEVDANDSTVPVRYGSEDCDAIDGFQPCVVHAEFCPACAAEAETWPEFIRTEEEERDWFRKGAQYQRWRAAAE